MCLLALQKDNNKKICLSGIHACPLIAPDFRPRYGDFITNNNTNVYNNKRDTFMFADLLTFIYDLIYYLIN